MLSLVMLINRAGSMVLPFLGVYMTDHLGFGLVETGVILSFYGVGSVMGSLLGGWLTDKYGEFYVQSSSLFISVPLFLIIPFFTTPVGLAVIIWLQSLVSESFRPANSVAITKYARPQNLTQAFSLNRMAINLGFSIGPAMGGILSAISYDLLFVVNAVAALLAGITYIYFFRKRHHQRKRSEAVNDDRVTDRGRSPYRDGLFVLFCLLCAIFAIFFFQFFNTIPIFYKEVVGLSQQHIGFILGYSGFIIVLLEMPLVNISQRRLTLAQTLWLGVASVAIAYGMMAIDHHLAVLLLSMTLLSLGEILVLPFISTLTAMRSGQHNGGAYMGLNGIAFSVSFIITPFLGTKIANSYGFDQLWVISGTILFSIAIAFYFLVRRMGS